MHACPNFTGPLHCCFPSNRSCSGRRRAIAGMHASGRIKPCKFQRSMFILLKEKMQTAVYFFAYMCFPATTFPGFFFFFFSRYLEKHHCEVLQHFFPRHVSNVLSAFFFCSGRHERCMSVSLCCCLSGLWHTLRVLGMDLPQGGNSISSSTQLESSRRKSMLTRKLLWHHTLGPSVLVLIPKTLSSSTYIKS